MISLSVFDFINVYSLLACIIALLWWYSQSSYNYWSKLNVKFLKPVPFFGNTAAHALRRATLYETLDGIYKTFFDEPFGGIYQMRDPILMVKDPKMVSDVLIKDFKNFHDHYDRNTGSYFNRNREANPLWVHLLRTHGERWRSLRQRMTSIFTPLQLKLMYDQIFYCVNLLTEKIDSQMNGAASVDVAAIQLLERYTIDIVGTCIFGIECNALKSNDTFARMCREVPKPRFPAFVRIILSIMGERVGSLLNLRNMRKEVSDFFLNTILDTMKFRRQNGIVRNDALQLLMDLQNSHLDPKFAAPGDSPKILPNETFDEIDIAANAFFFFVAGSDSTPMTLSYCLYELALNQNIQDKLRSEIQQVQNKYNISNFDSLKEMTYLDAVIAETFRKYPFAIFLSRTCTEDYVVAETKVRIPAGTKVIIPVWSLHHDWRYYPNPEVFDPERFIGENKQTRPNSVFLPLGDGPRACLGKRFIETEVKAALSAIILKYDIKPCAKTEIPLKFQISSDFLRTNHDVWINLTKRTT